MQLAEGISHLRKMKFFDIRQVVNVHITSFQGFFLTFLGPRFLSSLYAFFLSSPDGVCYVAIDDRKVIGFVCGSTQPEGFYRRFLYRRWLGIIFCVILKFLRNPTVFKRLLWRFINPPQAFAESGAATLMSIAVLPEYQNKRIGKALVQQFIAEVKRRGLKKVNLTTDKDNNEAVNAFYQKLGFKLARSFITPEGRWMNEYVINFDKL